MPSAGRLGDIRMFIFGFGLMLLLGLGWTFLKPAVENADAAAAPYWDKVKNAVSDITQKNWFKDQTVYVTADADGLRLATDEEVTEHKQYQEELSEAMRENREIMRMYYED